VWGWLFLFHPFGSGVWWGFLMSCIGAVYQPDHGGQSQEFHYIRVSDEFLRASGKRLHHFLCFNHNRIPVAASQAVLRIRGNPPDVQRARTLRFWLIVRRCNISGRQGSLPAAGGGNVTSSNPLHTVYPFLTNRNITGLTTKKKGIMDPRSSV